VKSLTPVSAKLGALIKVELLPIKTSGCLAASIFIKKLHIRFALPIGAGIADATPASGASGHQCVVSKSPGTDVYQ
jgi:hypothetical protein